MFFDPRKGSAIVADELVRLRERIVANMYKEGAVASGKTIRSLKVTHGDYNATLFSDQKMPFSILETGRKAGKVPDAFPYIIRKWMEDKGIHAEPIPYKTNRPHKYTEQERGDMSMAWAIAWKIEHEGTRLYRMGGRDTIYSQEIPKTIEDVKKKLQVFVQVATTESIKINTSI